MVVVELKDEEVLSNGVERVKNGARAHPPHTLGARGVIPVCLVCRHLRRYLQAVRIPTVVTTCRLRDVHDLPSCYAWHIGGPDMHRCIRWSCKSLHSPPVSGSVGVCHADHPLAATACCGTSLIRRLAAQLTAQLQQEANPNLPHLLVLYIHTKMPDPCPLRYAVVDVARVDDDGEHLGKPLSPPNLHTDSTGSRTGSNFRIYAKLLHAIARGPPAKPYRELQVSPENAQSQHPGPVHALSLRTALVTPIGIYSQCHCMLYIGG